MAAARSDAPVAVAKADLATGMRKVSVSVMRIFFRNAGLRHIGAAARSVLPSAMVAITAVFG